MSPYLAAGMIRTRTLVAHQPGKGEMLRLRVGVFLKNSYLRLASRNGIADWQVAQPDGQWPGGEVTLV